jgi:hypothetical protein
MCYVCACKCVCVDVYVRIPLVCVSNPRQGFRKSGTVAQKSKSNYLLSVHMHIHMYIHMHMHAHTHIYLLCQHPAFAGHVCAHSQACTQTHTPALSGLYLLKRAGGGPP